MLDKKLIFKICNACILLLAIFYVFYFEIGSDNSIHFIIFFLVASFFYSVRVMLHSLVYYFLYKKYTSEFYGQLSWLSFFSVSQLYGAFIPGAAFAMRAFAIKDRYNVSIKKSAIVYIGFYLSSIIMFAIIIVGYLLYLPRNIFYEYLAGVNFFGSASLIFYIIFLALIIILLEFIRRRIESHLSIFSKNIFIFSLIIQLISFLFTFVSFGALFIAINIQFNIIDAFNTFIVLQSLVYFPQFIPGNIGIQETFIFFTGWSGLNMDVLLLYSSTVRLIMIAGSVNIYLLSSLLQKFISKS